MESEGATTFKTLPCVFLKRSRVGSSKCVEVVCTSRPVHFFLAATVQILALFVLHDKLRGPHLW